MDFDDDVGMSTAVRASNSGEACSAAPPMSVFHRSGKMMCASGRWPGSAAIRSDSTMRSSNAFSKRSDSPSSSYSDHERAALGCPVGSVAVRTPSWDTVILPSARKVLSRDSTLVPATSLGPSLTVDGYMIFGNAMRYYDLRARQRSARCYYEFSGAQPSFRMAGEGAICSDFSCLAACGRGSVICHSVPLGPNN